MTSQRQVTLEEVISGIAKPSELEGAETRAVAGNTELADGVYYLNVKSSGNYLKYNTSFPGLQSGTLQWLGATIKWKITNVNGSFTIQPTSDLTKYLAVTTSSAVNAPVRYVTVSGTSIPTECLWNIVIANGGGCFIRSARNSSHIYVSSGNIYTTIIMPSVSSFEYGYHVWRIADSTWFYGNDSSYLYMELPSGYAFDTLYMFAGETKTPLLKDAYIDTLWSDTTDFTFSGFDSNRVALNVGSGEFTASSSTTQYTTTITTIHKVTGRTSTFTLVVNPKAVCVGVTNSGHDHISALNAISPKLIGCGYSGASVYSGAFTASDIDEYLDNDNNNVFVSRSHAGLLTANDVQIGTSLLLNDSSTNQSRYRSTESINILDLTNMQLVMFIACKTAAGGDGGLNLPTVAVAQGAQTAVGFEDNINCGKANSWTVSFFELMEEGLTVEEACLELEDREEYEGSGLSEYVICGYLNTQLN